MLWGRTRQIMNGHDMDKILINSLPKSGTNMVQKCLDLALVPYSGKSVAASSAFGRYAVIKQVLRMPKTAETPVMIGLEVPIGVSPRWLTSYLRRADGYVTGHAAYSEHYHAILRSQGYKMLQVIRHPCAVLASWASYIAEPGYYWREPHIRLAKLSIKQRIDHLLNGWGDPRSSFYYRSFRSVLNQLQGWVDAEGVLIVKYEDIVGGKGGGDDNLQRDTIANIFRHIGVPDDGVLMERVVSHLYGGTHTFRNGQVDGWRQVIDPGLESLIYDRLHDHPVMERLGYFE